MKKAFTGIILLTLLIPTTNMAQKAHRLIQPKRTQTEQQLTRITSSKEPLVLKSPHKGLRTIDPSVILWGNATINKRWDYYSFVNSTSKCKFT